MLRLLGGIDTKLLPARSRMMVCDSDSDPSEPLDHHDGFLSYRDIEVFRHIWPFDSDSKLQAAPLKCFWDRVG